MKKLIIFSGSHPRHIYLNKSIMDLFDEVIVFALKRENIIPEIPEGLDVHDEKNFIRHFLDRQKIELQQFGDLDLKTNFQLSKKLYLIGSNEINTNEKYFNIIRDFNADCAFIFGFELIKEDILKILPKYKINLHLGLSPWYKGSATLFWPFYFLQPQFAGVTFHQITDKPDAGEIFHQFCPVMKLNDGIHDLGARAVTSSVKEARSLLKKLISKKELTGKNQITSGRVWKTSDFMPSHLRVIYNLYNNDIVKHFLKGSLDNKKPKLFSCLR